MAESAEILPGNASYRQVWKQADSRLVQNGRTLASRDGFMKHPD
jgi:hypothetical protein